jgi:hypothetical protein
MTGETWEHIMPGEDDQGGEVLYDEATGRVYYGMTRAICRRDRDEQLARDASHKRKNPQEVGA